MTMTARVGVVVLGYVAAFVVASAVVTVRIAATAQAAQSAAGMYAFGDTVLFLAVIGALASVPTAAALWMMRGNRLIWTTLGAIAAAGAFISLVAVALYVTGRTTPAGSTLYVWTAWTPLWLLGALPRPSRALAPASWRRVGSPERFLSWLRSCRQPSAPAS
jgi:hypothetical protein